LYTVILGGTAAVVSVERNALGAGEGDAAAAAGAGDAAPLGAGDTALPSSSVSFPSSSAGSW
jgi:hypothetical protein